MLQLRAGGAERVAANLSRIPGAEPFEMRTISLRGRFGTGVEETPPESLPAGEGTEKVCATWWFAQDRTPAIR